MASFDLDAVVSEAKPAPKTKQFTFTWCGEEYALLTPSDSIWMDRLALNAAQRGDNITALLRLMTTAEFDRLVHSSKPVTGEHLISVLNAYYEYVSGLNAGESRASSPSSKNTARPSKRTSKSTTKSRSRS